MSRRLMATAVKLSILGVVWPKKKAELTLNDLLKRPVRRSLPRTSRPSGLPVCRGRKINTMKIKSMLVLIPTAVGALVAA